MVGILIISTGDRSYGEMAFNLAVSLKLADPDVKITVVSDGVFQSIRDSMIYIDEIVSVPKGSNPFELKTKAYELTPYKKTLMIDADTIFTGNDLKGFLKGLEEHKFLMIQKGPYSKHGTGKTIWAKIPDVYDHYGLDASKSVYPVFNSSLIYFQKSVQNRKYYKKAHECYKNPCRHTKIGKYFPDEVAFGAASAIMDHYTDDQWRPCYFQWYGGTPDHVQSSRNQYPFFSVAGGRQPHAVETLFRGTANRNRNRIGYGELYQFDPQKKVAYSGR